MAKKTLENLAKSYEVEDFFEYICETYLNGNKKESIELFCEMRTKDRVDFMNELNFCTFMHKFGDGEWQMEFLREILYFLYGKGWI